MKMALAFALLLTATVSFAQEEAPPQTETPKVQMTAPVEQPTAED